MPPFTEITDPDELDTLEFEINGAPDFRFERYYFWYVDRIVENFPSLASTFKRDISAYTRSLRIKDIKQSFNPRNADEQHALVKTLHEFELLGAENSVSESILKCVISIRVYQEPDPQFNDLAALEKVDRRGFIYTSLEQMQQEVENLREQYDRFEVI